MEGFVIAGTVRAALDYARKGWSIFPIQPRDKKPIGRLVPHGLKDATDDVKVIRAWWKEAPDANIGGPTGITFDVADLDSELALARFQALCREHGTDPRIFPRARTGGGGRHVFMAPTGIGNKAGWQPDMDWRGKGGYVVLPGSTHESGEAYEWITEPDDHLPPCPDWLLALLNPERPEPAPVNPSAEIPPTAYLEAAVDAEMHDLREAPVGQRNDQLNRSAFALGQMVGAGWLDQGRAEAELRAGAHAIDHGKEPGLTATIRSGLESGKKEPRQTPAGGFGGKRGVIIGSPILSVVPDALEGENVAPSLIQTRTLQELRNLPEADTHWIIYRFLAATAITDLAAFIKAGKSTLSAQMIAAICHGTMFLDEFETEKGSVVLLTEEPAAALIEAFADAGLTDADPLHIALWHENDTSPWADVVKGAADLCVDVGAKVLIVDTLSQWANVEDENDASQARTAMSPLLSAAARGIAVQIVRQSRKTGGEIHNAGRGSGAIGGAASILLHLDYERSEQGRYDDTATTRSLTIKSRLEREQAAAMHLDYKDGQYRMLHKAPRIIGQATAKERVLEAVRRGAVTSAEVVTATGLKEGTVRPNLQRLKTAGSIRIQEGVGYVATDPLHTPVTLPVTSVTSDLTPIPPTPLKGWDGDVTGSAPVTLQSAPELKKPVTRCPRCNSNRVKAVEEGSPFRQCLACQDVWTA